MEKVKTLIAGLGNTLVQDDAVGIYVCEKIKPHEMTDIFLCGVDVFRIMNVLNGHKRIILIDAVDAGLTPGAIICLNETGLNKFGNLSRSSHQISMLEAIKLMKLTLPEFQDIEIFFAGIQISGMEFNSPISEEVRISADWLAEVFL